MLGSPNFLTFPKYILDNFKTHFGFSNFWGLPPNPPSKTRCLSKIRRKIGRCSILNCSAPRPLTEMSQYSNESSCSANSKKYWLILVGVLWAEKFAIEIVRFLKKFLKFQKSQSFSILKSAIKCVKFNLKFLSWQTPHWNEPILLGILRTRPFHAIICYTAKSLTSNQATSQFD